VTEQQPHRDLQVVSMAPVQVTSGGKERIEPAAKVLCEAFMTDPTITYLLSAMEPSEREDYRPKFFRSLMTGAALNNGSLDEAGDWQSCGVIMPPDRTVGNLRTVFQSGLASAVISIGLQGTYRMLREMPPLQKECKAKCLKEKDKYYYIFFLGTLKEGRGKGLCSTIVRSYQEIAAKDDLPIYLEAANDYCCGLYKTLGFVTVGEFLLGKGKAKADGTPEAGGPGILLRGMIWRPGPVI